MSEIEQEPASGTIGVTIKYGKGYEDTWLNARGTVEQVRTNIMAYFGMTAEETAGLTLSEIVTNATNLAHAKGNLAAGLGATVISTKPKAGAPASGDPWAEAGQAAQPAQDGPSQAELLITNLKSAPDVDSLKRLWAENQALFSEAGVMDAYKARGAALTAAK